MKVKAISLFSGGLDSILAVKVISGMGIDVSGVTFETPFFNAKKAVTASQLINLPLTVIDMTEQFMKMLRKPRYGYGKNMNPCIDCHTLMLNLAGKRMLETGADFIFTGEVLGQRPMSQTKQSLHIVAKKSGFMDYILRPLSAQLLPEIRVDLEGKVDRTRLYAIQGRSRYQQLRMAKLFGIDDFAAPAGGCMLTDPIFSRKLKDLFVHNDDIQLREIELLKHGRHFRLNHKSKVIVGRNREDNVAIELLAKPSDILLYVENYPGPTTLITGDSPKEVLYSAASLCILYSDAPKNLENRVICSIDKTDIHIDTQAADREDARNWMV